MATTFQHGRWRIAFTDRSDGDFQFASRGVGGRRASIVGHVPVVWLRQVHGCSVATVSGGATAERTAGAEADAVVTSALGVALSVVTADCAPVAFVAGDVAAVVHAGWKGLVDGAIEATIAAVRAMAGADANVSGWLGPCIHPSSYAFGDDDLAVVADRYGDSVRGTTADGLPALNMTAGVAAACARGGVDVSLSFNADTASPAYYSHRTRRDPERQALFVWSEAL